MPTSWSLGIFAPLAVLFAVLSQVFAEDPPPLPIVWNPSARANDWNMFTLHATFPEDTDIDDATLTGLSRQAFKVMKGNPDYQAMTKQPGTMAALKVKNEIFFASPVRGHGSESFVYDWLTPRGPNPDPSQASDATPEQLAELASAGVSHSELDMIAEGLTDIELQLEACRIQIMQERIDKKKVNTNSGRHERDANCAEVVALHMYNVKNPLGGASGIRDKNAVVATWGIDSYGRGERLLGACGEGGEAPSRWGCAKLMESVGVRFLKHDDKRVIKENTIAPTSVEQIDVCERYL